MGEGPGPMAASEESATRRRTRGALMDAARQVFSEHGLSGATIDRITRAAGFTRGAFYSNFASREALMLAVLDREREREAAGISEYIAQVRGDGGGAYGIEQLTATLVDVLLIGAADREWQLAIMEALPITLRDPELAARQLQIRASTEADTRALVTQGLDRLGRRPTLDLDLLVLSVLGTVDRVLTDTLLQDEPLGTFSARAASRVATLLLHGSEPLTDGDAATP